MRGFVSLRGRGDFARVRRRGKRIQTPSLAIYSLMRESGQWRVGIVVGKAVGKAVERNLVRRRIREALELGGRSPRDLVIVARESSLDRSFAELAAELAGAL
jgi:ribonuclease P protein component